MKISSHLLLHPGESVVGPDGCPAHTVLAFSYEKLANIVQGGKQLKLQRVLGPQRLALILLEAASLIWVWLHFL